MGAGTAGLAAAIVAVALNQRPAVVAVSPLLDAIRSGTGLSAPLAGLLTTVPVLCFGAMAPVAPRLARRFGIERAVAVSLVLLAGGIALRLARPVGALFAGTLLAGVSIAVGNVLLPALIKRDFPARVGLVTGLYSGGLNVGAALAAGLTVPVMHGAGLSWRVALAGWAVLAVGALACWLPYARRGAPGTGPAPAVPVGALLRDPLAWQVTGFLGLNSFEFYAAAAWVPTLFRDAGLTDGRAGVLLATATVAGAVGALALPVWAGRRRSQVPIVLLVVALYAAGLGGLAIAPREGAWLWMVLFGVAQGGGFGLGLTLVVLRSPDPRTAAALSGLAQCGGYLVASVGPVTLGALHAATGGWTVPVVLLVALLAPMLAVGVRAARDTVVGSPDRRRRRAPYVHRRGRAWGARTGDPAEAQHDVDQ